MQEMGPLVKDLEGVCRLSSTDLVRALRLFSLSLLGEILIDWCLLLTNKLTSGLGQIVHNLEGMLLPAAALRSSKQRQHAVFSRLSHMTEGR